MEYRVADGIADNLSQVTEELQIYRQRTGREPLMLGGWEVEDRAIDPPALLLDRLTAIGPRPRHYTYGKDLHRARGQAAAVLGHGLRFDGARLAPEQVAVLHNSSQGLLLALTALRDAGVRRAVIAAPTYFATVRVCCHLGLDVVIVPAADFFTGGLDIARLASAMQQSHSVLVLTNPTYSLGVEYPQQQVQALLAALPEDAWALLDETRLGLHWQHDLPWYQGHLPQKTLVLRSPSKIFLLNGLKTSFLLGPARLLRSIEKLSESLVGSLAGNAEEVALAYLDTWQDWLLEYESGHIGPLRAWKRALIGRFRQHRDKANELLDQHGFMLSPVDSGPYVLAGIERRHLPTLDSLAIAREHGVLLMTSEYFYHRSSAWLGFRLNLCGDPWRTCEALERVLAPRREPFYAGMAH
jgi:aspartate/methionine/tyrosine aminotransferase